MLPSSSKMSDLAACLGIHRVSFARIARQNGVPGLVRTSTGRWRLKNRTAFKEFVERYRREAEARCKRASRFQNDRERELRSAVRFHRERFPNDERIPEACERELQRLKSGQIGESYTTTELASLLGVTSQTIRNWREVIPGVMLVGQRLRFEKSGKLTAFMKAKRASRLVGVGRIRKTVPEDPRKQIVMELLLGGTKVFRYDGSCIDETVVASGSVFQYTFLPDLGFRRRRSEFVAAMQPPIETTESEVQEDVDSVDLSNFNSI
jgi:hypothetical protein